MHLALPPFFLKVLVNFRTFKFLKDGCFSSPLFNMILLGLKQKTNWKDPDSASEILFTAELLFHEEIMERQLFLYCAKQTKLAVSLLKHWHFNVSKCVLSPHCEEVLIQWWDQQMTPLCEEFTAQGAASLR